MIRDAAHGFAHVELQPRVIKAFRDEFAYHVEHKTCMVPAYV